MKGKEPLPSSLIGCFVSVAKNEETQKQMVDLNSMSEISIFLSISYYIGFSPIKMKKLQYGAVTILSNTIQKSLCLFLVIVTNLVRFAEVRKRLPKTQADWNPLYYVKCISGIVNLVFNLSSSYTLFKQSEQIQKLSNYLNTSNTLPRPVDWLKKGAIWMCIALIFGEILLGTGLCLADMGIISMNGFQLTFTEWVWCMKEEANQVFFLNDEFPLCINGTNAVGQNNELFSADYVLALLLYFAKIFRHIHGYIGELLLLVGVATLWLPVSVFNAMIKHQDGSTNMSFMNQFEILHEKHSTLKHLSKLVNDVFGSMMFWFITASITYFSCNLDAFVISNNAFVKVRLLTFYLSAMLTLHLAADVSHKVKAFDDWLSEIPLESLVKIPQNTLALTIHELSSCKVGMTGGNLFVVTYSVMANIIGVLMTYFIVCVQFRSPWMNTYIS